MRKRKFNKTKEWLIEEYVNKNRSRKDVAKDCDLSESDLKSLLLEWKIEKNKLKLDVEYIKEQFENGVPIAKIGAFFGCREKPINRVINDLGLTRVKLKPNLNKYDSTNDELISSMYRDGLSSTIIAKYFNITHRTVLNHLTNCCIKRRTLIESQWNDNNKIFPKDLTDFETIYDLYIIKQLSKQEIANR